MARRRLAMVVPWFAVCVVLAGAAQQAAVALEWLAIGPAPGDGAAGQAVFLGGALLVLVVLGLVLPVAALAGRRVRALPAIAVAAALLVVARFSSFDPYYAPSLRRMSDGGILSGTWVVFVVACCVGAAVVAARSNRVGTLLVAAACWLAFGTAFLAGLGH